MGMPGYQDGLPAQGLCSYVRNREPARGTASSDALGSGPWTSRKAMFQLTCQPTSSSAEANTPCHALTSSGVEGGPRGLRSGPSRLGTVPACVCLQNARVSE